MFATCMMLLYETSNVCVIRLRQEHPRYNQSGKGQNQNTIKYRSDDGEDFLPIFEHKTNDTNDKPSQIEDEANQDGE